MVERAKLNDIAPKDVKQLEILKPINTPSMGERYKQALEKEKRLEAASRPIQKQTESKRKASSEGEEQPAVSKKNKRAKRIKGGVPSGKLDENALNQQDEVKEGINWSDDEE
jgi:hypothetical protein